MGPDTRAYPAPVFPLPRWLDPDALERAEGLPYALDLFLAGLLLASSRFELLAKFAESGDDVAEVAFYDFDL
jgi:hypothetical protein